MSKFARNIPFLIDKLKRDKQQVEIYYEARDEQDSEKALEMLKSYNKQILDFTLMEMKCKPVELKYCR